MLNESISYLDESENLDPQVELTLSNLEEIFSNFEKYSKTAQLGILENAYYLLLNNNRVDEALLFYTVKNFKPQDVAKLFENSPNYHTAIETLMIEFKKESNGFTPSQLYYKDLNNQNL